MEPVPPNVSAKTLAPGGPSRWIALVVACSAVAGAVLARLGLTALVGPDAPLLPFFLGVIAAAWYGGLLPGLAATGMSAFVGITYFMDPPGTPFFANSHKTFWVFGFAGVGGAISAVCESLHRLRRQREIILHQQREAEELARANEHRFRLAIEYAPFPIALRAEDGEILSVNRAWIQLTGYTHSDLRNIRDWIERVCRDKALAHAESLRTFTEDSDRVEHGEIVGYAASGEEFTLDFSTAVLGVLPDGRRYAISMAKDVSQRKRSEGQANLFRALLERANDSISVVNPVTGQFLHVNEKGCESLGYTLAEITRLTVRDVAPEVSPETFTVNAEKLKHGESLRFETLHRRKDGSTFPVEVSLNWFKLEQEYVVAIVRDVSERKQSEEELRRLMTAVESTANGIVITDVRGNIEWVNPAFTRMTGYTKEESIGRNPRILKSGNQDKRFYTELWRTIISGHVWRGVLCNRKKDGSLYYEDMSITPVRNDKGAITHFISIKEDMSAKRHLEQQLHQSQKLEAIGRLAGGVAHDFNNLLTVISGYSEILLMKLAPDDPTRSSLKPIHEAAERAAGLTRQLLSFSRQAVIQPVVISLNDTLREMEKMLHRMIGEDIVLTFVLDPKVSLVKADPGQIGQVLMNLAVNARDAMPQGGKLTVETATVVLDATYVETHPGVRPGTYVMLAMSDTGTGMPPDVRARIFEPFFTTKGVGQGTGLGLSVVHGIINQAGGSIEVYTEVGLGTTFKIYLPAFLDESIRTKTQAEFGVQPGHETVLLVEDEDAVRGIAILALQSNGYSVLAAGSGKEALAIFDSHGDEIALLITDVVMPGMSGRELAQVLQERSRSLKVLYVSGYTDDAVVRHGLLQEQVAFLQKPYSPLGLARRVREILDKD